MKIFAITISIIAFIIIIVMLEIHREGNFYKLRSYNIISKKIKNPVKIVLLSDLHGKKYSENNVELIADIVNERPDLIICAGDMIIFRESDTINEMADFFVNLSQELKMNNNLSAKMFFINGNHEKRALKYDESGKLLDKAFEKMEKCGVRCLFDSGENVCINNNNNFYIYGLDLLCKYYKHIGATPITEDVIKNIPLLEDNKYNILISHHPEVFHFLGDKKFDLTLSGHLHGGEIYLPGIGGLVTPQFKLFHNRVKGLFVDEEKTIVISAGLGGHKKTIRLNNPAELVSITINKG